MVSAGLSYGELGGRTRSPGAMLATLALGTLLLVSGPGLSAQLTGRRHVLLLGITSAAIFTGSFVLCLLLLPQATSPGDPYAALPPALAVATGGMLVACLPPTSLITQAMRVGLIAIAWGALSLAGEQGWGTSLIRGVLALALALLATILPVSRRYTSGR
jgi:hypothetical protein